MNYKEMKKRPPKNDDNENTEKAYQLLMKLMTEHAEIESSLWYGALWSLLANGYKENNLSYEDFSKEVKRAMKHYKSWFEQ